MATTGKNRIMIFGPKGSDATGTIYFVDCGDYIYSVSLATDGTTRVRQMVPSHR
jgi:hypothetical protein